LTNLSVEVCSDTPTHPPTRATPQIHKAIVCTSLPSRLRHESGAVEPRVLADEHNTDFAKRSWSTLQALVRRSILHLHQLQTATYNIPSGPKLAHVTAEICTNLADPASLTPEEQRSTISKSVRHPVHSWELVTDMDYTIASGNWIINTDKSAPEEELSTDSCAKAPR
jgi:hypothetical protein